MKAFKIYPFSNLEKTQFIIIHYDHHVAHYIFKTYSSHNRSLHLLPNFIHFSPKHFYTTKHTIAVSAIKCTLSSFSVSSSSKEVFPPQPTRPPCCMSRRQGVDLKSTATSVGWACVVQSGQLEAMQQLPDRLWCCESFSYSSEDMVLRNIFL